MEVKSYQPVGPTYCTFNLIVNSVQCPPSGEVSTTTRASHSDILGIILVMEIELKYWWFVTNPDWEVSNPAPLLLDTRLRHDHGGHLGLDTLLTSCIPERKQSESLYIGDIRGNISVSQRGDTSLVTARTWGSCHVTLHLVVWRSAAGRTWRLLPLAARRRR